MDSLGSIHSSLYWDVSPGMTIKLTSIEVTDVQIPKRTEARIRRDAMRHIAMHHKRVTLGKHFKKVAETEPGGEYGYRARSPRYLKRKIRQGYGDIPNVRTKRLQRYVYSNSVVTATQDRSRVYMKAPFPLNEQRRKELEAITPKEASDASNLGQQFYNQRIADPSVWSKRKRRVS